MARRPTILVFDSGLGGLTVYAEVARRRPDADLVYAADDAGFPYGRWNEIELAARVASVLGGLIELVRPALVVIACNTASTLVLPELRALFPDIPFVGTVPAIKPAAALSRSKLISVLATPGTVARDYTRTLVAHFASDCRVTLVGSIRLASLAEAAMAGDALDDADVLEEIEPCFVAGEGRRTDVVVLACTHYPLLNTVFQRLQPWPVTWIDPAPAIARRVDDVLCGIGYPGDPLGGIREATPAPAQAIFSSGRTPSPALVASLARYGLQTVSA